MSKGSPQQGGVARDVDTPPSDVVARIQELADRLRRGRPHVQHGESPLAWILQVSRQLRGDQVQSQEK